MTDTTFGKHLLFCALSRLDSWDRSKRVVGTNGGRSILRVHCSLTCPLQSKQSRRAHFSALTALLPQLFLQVQLCQVCVGQDLSSRSSGCRVQARCHGHCLLLPCKLLHNFLFGREKRLHATGLIHLLGQLGAL